MLFADQGYSTTQVDQIAQAACVSRQTFYLHFKDKEEVVRDIAVAHAPRAVAVMRLLKGPSVDRRQIREWLDEWVTLVSEEKAAIAIIGEMARSDTGAPLFIDAHIGEIVAALAETFEAFGAAQRPGPLKLQAKFRIESLILQTNKACCLAGRGSDPAFAEAALEVAAEMFHDFIMDPRFRAPSTAHNE